MTRKAVEVLDLSHLDGLLEESLDMAHSLVNILEQQSPSTNGNGHGHVAAEDLAPYDNQRMA